MISKPKLNLNLGIYITLADNLNDLFGSKKSENGAPHLSFFERQTLLPQARIQGINMNLQVIFPFKMEIFHSKLLVYQRLSIINPSLIQQKTIENAIYHL